MAELMNWPPSRGPNPHEWRVTYKPGKITREDFKLPPSPAAGAEQDVLEDAGLAIPPPLQIDLEPVRTPVIGSWRVWYQVDDVASLTLEQAVNLLSGNKTEPEWNDFDSWIGANFGTLQTVIDYPLNTAVHLTIEPMIVARSRGKEPEKEDRDMRLGYFLWVVAKEYERIYREHEKYGIWGHALGDLGFERLDVHEDGMVDLSIGS